MELGKTLAQAIGELQGTKKQSASGHDAVGQEVPPERMDVHPVGILGVDEKVLVVAKDVGEHQADKGEEQIFWAEPRDSLQRQRRAGNGSHWTSYSVKGFVTGKILQKGTWTKRNNESMDIAPTTPESFLC